MIAKFCDLCGQPLVSGSKFCSNCGQPVRSEVVPAIPPQVTQAPSNEVLKGMYLRGEITLEEALAQCSNQTELKRSILQPSGESILTIKYKGFFLDTSVVNFGIAFDEKVEVSGKDFAKSFEHRLKSAPGQHMLRVIHFLVDQKLIYPIPIWKTSKEVIVAHQWEIHLIVGHNHVELKADRAWGGMLLTLNGSGAAKGYKVTVPGTTPLTRAYWDEKG